MRTLLKKYAIVAIPLFLCALIISYKPALITAATTCYDNNNQVVDCGSADAVSADNGQGAAQISGGSTANPSSGTVTGNPANNNPTPSYTLLEPLPCIPSKGETSCTSGGKTYTQGSFMSSVDFQNYVQYFFNLVIALAAAAAVFAIALAGLQYMTTESWTGKGDSIKRLKNAIFGLVIVLCSYFLLQIIDPRLVAIPSTLVPPLNINYKNTTSAFMTDLTTQVQSLDQISQQTNALMNQANQIRNDTNAELNTISNDQTNITNLQNQIANAMVQSGYANEDPNDITPDEITSLCNDNVPVAATGNSNLDEVLNSSCSQIAQKDQEINQTQANITAETAQGMAYAQVE